MSLPVVPLGRPRPRRADAARNREHLIAVARDVLAERGTAGITMDGLAECAGLGKGTVFRAFGTRAGIFRALLEADETAFQTDVIRGEPPLGPGADPVQRLIEYGRARSTFLMDHLEVMRATVEPGGRIAAPGVEFTQVHVRMLLVQADLGIADVDNLAIQLALALEGPLLLASYTPPPPTAKRVGSLEDSWQTLIERLSRPAR
ncbi:MAG TPA: TetR/AcrR family transcriptional regulator [Flexivirga sp.]|uniref:TetR/AcrR family transcriptional regulator n=1 Tax=Flexivirga sp. TaxID=1962927 RepID=UPI002CFA7039|nr:TetR/AcrR family transcriptional regulator [Flexivirga sp.]HWC22776.1 TetR/AcrR family transcriptional regulator [Flexivirga sp.]